MLKCPFCQFDNEDGALFCEQCKSDLGFAAEPVAAGNQAGHVEDPDRAAFVFLNESSPAPEPEGGTPFSFGEPAAEAEPVAFEQFAEAEPVRFEPDVEAPIPLHEDIPHASPVEEDASHATAVQHSESTKPFPMPAAPLAGALPNGAIPKLIVMRGLKVNVEYPIYDGDNFIGRADEKPVDIDLEDQEPPDRIWSSRQHALITLQDGALSIEDLNSSNGTFVNRSRLYPGQHLPLKVNDVIQIGTVQMKVKV